MANYKAVFIGTGMIGAHCIKRTGTDNGASRKFTSRCGF